MAICDQITISQPFPEHLELLFIISMVFHISASQRLHYMAQRQWVKDKGAREVCRIASEARHQKLVPSVKYDEDYILDT